MRDYLCTLKADVVREVKESWQYRMGLMTDLLVQFLLYVGLLFAGKFTWLTRQYTAGSGESKSLLLIGFIFWSYSIAAISQMGIDIGMEASRGTLEQKFMAVVPPPVLLLGKAVGGIAVSSILVAVMIAVSAILLGVDLNITSAAILALGITLIGMYGIGFIFAGIALVAKRTGQLIFLVQLALLFLSGIFMPLEDMPVAIAVIGQSLPLTRGIDIARRAAGNYLPIRFQDWFMLTIASLACLVIGLISFSVADRQARKKGLLGKY